MGQNSSLVVRPGSYYIKFQQDHMDICDGCFACAAIIGALDDICDGQPGAYVISWELLNRHLLGLVAPATIDQHISDLAAKGYLITAAVEDKVYQLNFDRINDAVAALPGIPLERSIHASA